VASPAGRGAPIPPSPPNPFRRIMPPRVIRKTYIPHHFLPTQLPAASVPEQSSATLERVVPARNRGIIAARAFLGWAVAHYRAKFFERKNAARDGNRLRVCLEQAGGLWIEIGKMLALRSDIFPLTFCEELNKTDHAPVGFPFSQFCDVFEKETGELWQTYFSHLDPEPFIVSSLSQIHRATLRKNGLNVLVKVLRPGCAEAFASDLKTLQKLGTLLRLLRFMPRLRFEEMYFELQSRVQQNSDYRYEASNLKKMRKSLRSHGVYVPKVVQECSTRQVLTMEFLPTVRLKELIELEQTDPQAVARWMLENNIDRKKIARRMFHSFFRQLCEDNLCHGNIRPSNVFLLKDSRFALIDMDTVHTAEKRFLTIYTMMLRALSEKDYEKVADCIFLLCESVPAMNLAEVRTEIVRCYRSYAARADLMKVPYEQKSLGAVGSEAASVLFRRSIVASWEFMKVTKTWSTLDQSLSVLHPEANFFRLMSKYFRKASDRQFRNIRQEGVKPLLSRAVGTVSEILLFQTSNLRKQAQVFQGYTSKVSYLLAVVFKLASRLIVLGLLYGVFEFLNQYYNYARTDDNHVDLLENTWVMDLVRHAEHHSYQAFILAFIGGIYVYRLLSRLAGRFRAEEIELPKS
jgi:ubiquinone biosynthesis protein